MKPLLSEYIRYQLMRYNKIPLVDKHTIAKRIGQLLDVRKAEAPAIIASFATRLHIDQDAQSVINASKQCIKNINYIQPNRFDVGMDMVLDYSMKISTDVELDAMTGVFDPIFALNALFYRPCDAIEDAALEYIISSDIGAIRIHDVFSDLITSIAVSFSMEPWVWDRRANPR